MAYFAKKIDYCANETSFVALIEIAKKKGGKPIKFILYRYAMNYGAEMIDFGNNKKKAKKYFPYGPVVFEEEIDVISGGDCSYLPKTRKNLWKKTTGWLYEVAIGGGYEIHSSGDWIKVGRPAIWKKHRRKMCLRFGELGHILLVNELRLRNLNSARNGIQDVLDDILFYYDDEGEQELRDDLNVEEKNRVGELEAEIESINNLISKTESEFLFLRSEMKHKRSLIWAQK